MTFGKLIRPRLRRSSSASQRVAVELVDETAFNGATENRCKPAE
jgi:hypothetical protein